VPWAYYDIAIDRWNGERTVAQAVVSTKYQVVIPREVRQAIGLSPGQAVQVLAKGGVITLVPLRPTRELRGFVKGMRPGTIREKKDRH
jgi:AbrB family looped-hinge helix DNA binding protein